MSSRSPRAHERHESRTSSVRGEADAKIVNLHLTPNEAGQLHSQVVLTTDWHIFGRGTTWQLFLDVATAPSWRGYPGVVKRLALSRVKAQCIGQAHQCRGVRLPGASFQILNRPHAESRALGESFLGEAAFCPVGPQQGGKTLAHSCLGDYSVHFSIDWHYRLRTPDSLPHRRYGRRFRMNASVARWFPNLSKHADLSAVFAGGYR